MARTIGWSLLAFLGLAVLAVISLPTADRDQLVEAVGRRAIAHSSAGMGYDDGQLVWRDTEPCRITVEQLPSLEGRRLGSSWHSGFLLSRMSWFGVTLRSAIAQCLEIPIYRVVGDESLDELWFDVDAAQTHSLFESGFGQWDAVRARILEGFCEHYGLTVGMETAPLQLTVLRAGPGWLEHEIDSADDKRSRHVLNGDGTLSVQGMSVSSLLHVLRENLGFQESVGLDMDALCSFEISWDASDSDDLARVLAKELDLHLEEGILEVEVARVDGVPRPPPHLR